ncbi:MAG: hypothetical protein OIF55_19135 [Amphritea sp.]|nr:hypothetical protein [Amphritea sp.]
MNDKTASNVELKQFNREERYTVFKITDLQEADNISPGDKEHLIHIESCVNAHRHNRDAKPLECVVVESDWPEYETVWRMIESRANGHQPKSRAADAFKLPLTTSDILITARAGTSPTLKQTEETAAAIINQHDSLVDQLNASESERNSLHEHLTTANESIEQMRSQVEELQSALIRIWGIPAQHRTVKCIDEIISCALKGDTWRVGLAPQETCLSNSDNSEIQADLPITHENQAALSDKLQDLQKLCNASDGFSTEVHDAIAELIGMTLSDEPATEGQ